MSLKQSNTTAVLVIAQKQCQPLLVITEQVEFIQLKVNNNKVMYHLSMKLSDMFDPNPMNTSDN